jgi:hypothetical protein
MRIKIWASNQEQSPYIGPYKMLDIIDKDVPYVVADITHYGEVVIVARSPVGFPLTFSSRF